MADGGCGVVRHFAAFIQTHMGLQQRGIGQLVSDRVEINEWLVHRIRHRILVLGNMHIDTPKEIAHDLAVAKEKRTAVDPRCVAIYRRKIKELTSKTRAGDSTATEAIQAIGQRLRKQRCQILLNQDIGV